jgi:hypothetical protein
MLIRIMIFIIVSVSLSYAKTPTTIELAAYDTLLKRCEANNKMYVHLLEKTNDAKYRDSIMITLEIYASIKAHKRKIINHKSKIKFQ